MTSSVKINPSSVFLVTGGAKGITARSVIELAKHFPCKWLLLGRSEIDEFEPVWAKDCFDESELKKRIVEDFLAGGKKPIPKEIERVFKAISSTREIQNTLSTLQQLGSQVEYISVDVTDAIALQEKLAPAIDKLGAITGIIHGAGNLADKLIEKKTLQDFETVYSAKVKGLENLLRWVPQSQLDYLILFSSIVGFYGNAGQTDYAIANEILNKTAHLVKQHHPKCHVVAIGWGPLDGGMMTEELKKAYALRNIKIIPLESATEILVNELTTANSQRTQIVVGSPLPPLVIELDSQLRTHRIRRQLTVESNPFLHDHVIGGYAVLPFTCAMSWIANTCEQVYPGYKFLNFTNFKLLKGVRFDESVASQYVLELKEISKNAANGIEIDALISSETKEGKIRYHFQTRSHLLPQIPKAPIYEFVNLTEDRVISETGDWFYSNDDRSLFHGVTFRGVEKVLNINSEKITTQCLVPNVEEKQQGQFPSDRFNGYIADVTTHAVWIWLQHLHGRGCLPNMVDKFERYAEVKFNQEFYVTTEIVSQTESGIIVNIVAHDRAGSIYCRTYGSKATVFPFDYLSDKLVS